jgi:hypothetical protein
MQLWALKCYHVSRIHEATRPGALQTSAFVPAFVHWLRSEIDAIEKIEVEEKAMEEEV